MAGANADLVASILATSINPIPFGALGHYRVQHRFAIANTQAAASNLFEVRNTGTGLLVLTALRVSWLQTGAHTAAIEDSLDVLKVTGFTAVDTVNTVTPTAVSLRTSMAAAPGNAAIRGVTIAGAAAGMTGGTLTAAGSAYMSLVQWLLAAQPTAGIQPPLVLDYAVKPYEHPFVMAANEGLVIQNRVLLGAAAASSVYIEAAWADVTAF